MQHLDLLPLIASSVLLLGASPPRFEVRFDRSARAEPVDGRLLLTIATRGDREPRFSISAGLDTQQIFGVDVEHLAPGQAAVIDASTLGYPRESLADIPAGDYWVQGLIHVYETFPRADGQVIKLPMDDGEGQDWSRSPGNLYSEPRIVRLDPARGGVVRVDLTRAIPPIEPPQDNKYVKHVRLQSDLLSKFWGRPMYLGAVVLLPEGFEEHPEARFPVLYRQGHFQRTFSSPGWRAEPPGPELAGFDRTLAEYQYKFYQDWTAGRLPRMLVVETQHANPYYDDSYGVNSANVGPYGDAIVRELIPYVEKKFRAVGEPWARVLDGGSTGGWIALAQQVFYPDFFNGAWCYCPDSVDFRAYQQVNIYEDKNAYWADSEWKRVPRVDRRDTNGKLTATMEDANRLELVLGTRSRSGEQWDIWQAVYSPVGPDGYPKPIYDKRTGVINREVVQYWKENYDLAHILRRDWKNLGPKLAGKIHIKVGDSDNFFLEGAVRLLQEFLEGTKDLEQGPYYAGSIEYGNGHGHCYTGDPSVPTRVAWLTINQRLLPVMVERMLKTAPPGADVRSWRY